MEITRKVWEIFKTKNNFLDVCLSQLVFDEIKKCSDEKKLILRNYLKEINYSIVEFTEESEKIYNLLLSNQILSKRSISDCKHLGMAMASNCEYILSWNFKHFVRPKTKDGAKKIASEENLNLLDITSPKIFL